MVWTVKRASAVTRDLEAIFDFLYDAALGFGDPPRDAFDRAARRIGTIETALESLANAPHQGTLRDDLLPGVRHVTKNRAIIYFDLDEDTQTLRILAVFFGGQDHQRQMLIRLLSQS